MLSEDRYAVVSFAEPRLGIARAVFERTLLDSMIASRRPPDGTYSDRAAG